jgi:PhnB protein
MAKAQKAVPEGHHTITPQLTLDNAARTIEWYKKALGAEELGRHLGPDGKVMHAELRIGDSRIMVNDVMMGKGPKGYGGSPASLWIYVEDCDALFNRAVAAGAKVASGPMGQVQDQFWGDRSGTIVDPEGYQWTIATHKEDLTPQELEKRSEDGHRAPCHRPSRRRHVRGLEDYHGRPVQYCPRAISALPAHEWGSSCNPFWQPRRIQA